MLRWSDITSRLIRLDILLSKEHSGAFQYQRLLSDQVLASSIMDYHSWSTGSPIAVYPIATGDSADQSEETKIDQSEKTKIDREKETEICLVSPCLLLYQD